MSGATRRVVGTKMSVGIQYVAGDATLPLGNGAKIIAHIVNDVGAWGKGFVMALGARYPLARSSYMREWKNHKLGQCWVESVGTHLAVAHLMAQRGIRGRTPGKRHVRYGALRRAIQQLQWWANNLDASVHMPRIGCGLGGGSWDVVSRIIEVDLTDKGVTVYVYGRKQQ